MPRRASRCGGSPTISVPSYAMRPSLGARKPAIIANSVVLPAPFGPISAVMRPASAASETRLTASRPPKRFETFSTPSSGSAMAAPQQAGDAVRRKGDDDDQHTTVNHKIKPRRVTGDELGCFAERAHHQCAKQRSEHGADAADDRGQQG